MRAFLKRVMDETRPTNVFIDRKVARRSGVAREAYLRVDAPEWRFVDLEKPRKKPIELASWNGDYLPVSPKEADKLEAAKAAIMKAAKKLPKGVQMKLGGQGIELTCKPEHYSALEAAYLYVKSHKSFVKET